jgi:endonuclease/exonuclease/phosphatase (EEP) superfamily protein YafD
MSIRAAQRLTALTALASAILLAPASAATATAATDAVQAAATTAGTFSALTYNVAGLPEGLSSSHPAANTPYISQRIRAYDVVNVQEDFNYHATLYASDDHQYRTATSGGAGFGGGLNTLSRYPLVDFGREKWNACNGTDCLTPKGFTYARLRLADGVYLDLYNVHTNAGTADADLAARRSNVSQLTQYILDNSAGNAVLVMGDTNTRYTRSGDNIRELGQRAGLTDAWVSLVRGGVPPESGAPPLTCDASNVTDACEVVDKVLYRGSALLSLTATRYHNEHAAFLGPDGGMLSDHDPHLVAFNWQVRSGVGSSDVFGGPHGTPFTDVTSIVGAAPRRFLLRAGSRVDAVGVELGAGVTLTHGGSGGTSKALALAAGEYVTQVRLCAGQKDGRTRIFFIELRTNRGAVLAGGTQTGDTVTFAAPAGWQVAGFHGRAAAEIDELVVLYTPLA